MKDYKVTVDEQGNIHWYNSEGQLDREDGPAVEWADGSKFWYLNGKRHREDGPAVEWADGYKSWYLNGQYHREDGPAVERVDGGKFWYLNGIIYSKEEYYTKKNTCDGKVVEIDGKKYKLTEIE